MMHELANEGLLAFTLWVKPDILKYVNLQRTAA